MLLPGTPKSGATMLAERLRASVEETCFDGRDTQPLGRVTLSIGLSTFPEDGADRPTLIARADMRMYAAKKAGRNRVFDRDVQ